MSASVQRGSAIELDSITGARLRWNLASAALYEEAVRRQEGIVSAGGALSCRTGSHTGRSPNDKFFVREPSSEANIAWGSVNRPMAPAHFEELERDFMASLQGAELFVLDCHVGASATYRVPVRVVTELAWHNLFARHMFIVDRGLPAEAPEFTIINSPSFQADPARHGTRSNVVIAVNLAKRLVLIGGTSYAGETKKSVFTILNYLLPLKGVLS